MKYVEVCCVLLSLTAFVYAEEQVTRSEGTIEKKAEPMSQVVELSADTFKKVGM